jgi:hypothetical protein
MLLVLRIVVTENGGVWLGEEFLLAYHFYIVVCTFICK